MEIQIGTLEIQWKQWKSSGWKLNPSTAIFSQGQSSGWNSKSAGLWNGTVQFTCAHDKPTGEPHNPNLEKEAPRQSVVSCGSSPRMCFPWDCGGERCVPTITRADTTYQTQPTKYKTPGTTYHLAASWLKHQVKPQIPSSKSHLPPTKYQDPNDKYQLQGTEYQVTDR